MRGERTGRRSDPPDLREVQESGPVMSVRELAREYIVLGINRGEVVVRRKSCGRIGTLCFRHGAMATVFFGFRPLPVG